jgi:hypothetical protein
MDKISELDVTNEFDQNNNLRNITKFRRKSQKEFTVSAELFVQLKKGSI